MGLSMGRSNQWVYLGGQVLYIYASYLKTGDCTAQGVAAAPTSYGPSVAAAAAPTSYGPTATTSHCCSAGNKLLADRVVCSLADPGRHQLIEGSTQGCAGGLAGNDSCG